MSKRRQEIERALDDAINEAFPASERGKPRSPLAARAEAIVTTACMLLDIGLTAYNFEDEPAQRRVVYNLKYADSEGRTVVCGSWICHADLRALSDAALTTRCMRSLPMVVEDMPGIPLAKAEDCP